MGVFTFTVAALFALRIIALFVGQTANQIGQIYKSSGMQRRTPTSQFHENIRFHKIRPDCGNLTQLAVFILKIHIALAVNAPVLHKLELFAFQGMERMGDPQPAAFFSRVGCNREVIETGNRKKDPARVRTARRRSDQ